MEKPAALTFIAAPLSAQSEGSQLETPAALAIWHLLSLDAPTVAVVWALGFAWVTGVRLPLWIPVLLALVAWVVYVADRLLDAHACMYSAQLHRLRQRHHFHWRHRRILVPLAVGAACAAAWIVFRLMPIGACERNSILAIAALAYFSGVHAANRFPKIRRALPVPILSKEFLVALLFTAACALPALSRAVATPRSQSWPLFCVAIYFVALAWLNCHSIERWESGSRRSNVLSAACLLGLAGLLLAAVLSPIQPRSAALLAVGATSALLLWLLDRARARLTPLALRVAADLVLLTPLLLLQLGPNAR